MVWLDTAMMQIKYENSDSGDDGCVRVDKREEKWYMSVETYTTIRFSTIERTVSLITAAGAVGADECN